MSENEARTITFGDVAENGPGMEHIGSPASKGLSLEELTTAKTLFEKQGYQCELIDLRKQSDLPFSPEDLSDSAQILIVRNGVEALAKTTHHIVNAEQKQLIPDKKAWMRGVVKNKRARWNLCFADQPQTADLENKKGTVVQFKRLPLLNSIRESIPLFFGYRTKSLNAELNVYYDLSKCGIGFHGDAERFITIGMRFGHPFPFHYQWFYLSKPIGKRILIHLNPGDLYAMGAKAVGHDWRRRNLFTLRHAAGADKFLRT